MPNRAHAEPRGSVSKRAKGLGRAQGMVFSLLVYGRNQGTRDRRRSRQLERFRKVANHRLHRCERSATTVLQPEGVLRGARLSGPGHLESGMASKQRQKDEQKQADDYGTHRANHGTMQLPKNSPCGRFVVLDGLHLDRVVFEAVATWASERGLHLQDAIQLALCAFNEGSHATAMAPSATMAIGAIGWRSPHVPATEPAER